MQRNCWINKMDLFLKLENTPCHFCLEKKKEIQRKTCCFCKSAIHKIIATACKRSVSKRVKEKKKLTESFVRNGSEMHLIIISVIIPQLLKYVFWIKHICWILFSFAFKLLAADGSCFKLAWTGEVIYFGGLKRVFSAGR